MGKSLFDFARIVSKECLQRPARKQCLRSEKNPLCFLEKYPCSGKKGNFRLLHRFTMHACPPPSLPLAWHPSAAVPQTPTFSAPLTPFLCYDEKEGRKEITTKAVDVAVTPFPLSHEIRGTPLLLWYREDIHFVSDVSFFLCLLSGVVSLLSCAQGTDERQWGRRRTAARHRFSVGKAGEDIEYRYNRC